MNEAGSPAKESQVKSEIQILQQNIESAEKAVACLDESLASVLVPSAPQPPQTVSEKEPSLVGLATIIRETAARISRLRQNVLSITARLEL